MIHGEQTAFNDLKKLYKRFYVIYVVMCQMLKGSLSRLDKTASVMKNRSMVKMQALLSLGSFLITPGKLSLRFIIHF